MTVRHEVIHDAGGARREAEAYREAVHREVDELLDRRLRSKEKLPAPADLARFGIKAAAAEHELAELVGPVYSTRGVRELTGWERQQLEQRRKRGTILAMRTSDGVWVYPVFQFTDGAIDPRVTRLLNVFRHVENVDWWTVAAWIASPKSDLGGGLPLEVESEDELLEIAAEAASRWAA